MKLKMKVCLFLAFTLLLGVSYASASSVCPIVTGGVAGGGTGVSATYTADSGGTNGGCNVLITFNADGSITTTNPNASISYDIGADDNLIGIINNTGKAINSLFLSSNVSGPTAIFNFDGDGICDPTWQLNGSFTNTSTLCSGATGYGHGGASAVTFSSIATNKQSGFVNFAGGIAAGGGSNWFSLEGPVDVNLAVSQAPEPGSLILFGTGIAALAGSIRRKLRR